MPAYESFRQSVESARRKHPEIAATVATIAMTKTLEQTKNHNPEAIDNLINLAAAKNQKSNNLNLSNQAIFETIPNPEVRTALESTLETAKAVYEHPDLENPHQVPDLQQFLDVGVDLIKLTDDYLEMQDNNLEPIIVIAPTLHASEQINVFNNLTKQGSAIPNNPLRKRSYNIIGIALTDSIEAHADAIFEQELDRTKSNLNIHSVTGATDQTTWSISIVPGTEEPQHMNTPHAANRGNHISFSTYLAMQAELIQQGKSPIDQYNLVWLEETIGRTGATFVHFMSGGGFIRVDADSATSIDRVKGARLPVFE
jgi:hypothetical protein